MRFATRGTSLLLAGALLSVMALEGLGAASPVQLLKPKNEVQVETLPGTDYTAYASYDWSKSQGPGNAEKLANHIRITQAIQRELSDRGIEPNTTRPALRVLYEYRLRNELKGTSRSGATTIDPTNQRTNVDLGRVAVGTITVTFFDGETNQRLWKATLAEEVETPDRSERQINRAVAKLFEKYPVAVKEKK